MDSPEVKKVNENMTEAVKDTLRAYGWDEDFLLTNFIVVCAQTRFDEDGDQETRYTTLHQDGAIPWHIAFGLLECAKIAMMEKFRSE